MPETKGLSLESVDHLFRQKDIVASSLNRDFLKHIKHDPAVPVDEGEKVKVKTEGEGQPTHIETAQEKVTADMKMG